MKKIIAAILCIVLLICTIIIYASREKRAYSAMIKLLTNMDNVAEGEMSIEFSFPGYDKDEGILSAASAKGDNAVSKLTKAFLESDISGISVNGITSYEKQQMQMSIDYSRSNGESEGLTEIITIGDESYVNMSEMLAFISPLVLADSGNSANYTGNFFTALMDGNEYIYAGDSGVWDSDNQLTSTVKKLSKSFYSYLADLNIVIYGNNAYSFTLEGESYRYVLTGILTDIKDSSDLFSSAIISALDQAGISYLGASLPEVSELSDELTGFLNSQISDLNYNNADGLKMTGTVSYDKESKTYTQKLNFMKNNESIFEITNSVVDTAVVEVAVPDRYLTHEEFDKNFGDLRNFLSIYGNAGNGKTLIYITKESDTIQPFVGRAPTDLESDNTNDYTSDNTILQFYDYTAKSGTVYSVPLLVSDKIETKNGALIAESPGMWQYFFSFNKNEDTAKTFLERHVRDNYNLYYDSPSNSNMTISHDESLAVMSFSYDNAEYGKTTMIYVVMVSESGEDILLMSIDIYHDYMEDLDYSILEELSAIIGINLSEFY